jgi:hypothetical protein
VTGRFHIDDLVAQDTQGVVYRAQDRETGQWVALRRWFPFGAIGGGLNAGEQADYAASITQLMEITHPALRAVVAGGCDPVDGIPFIATEWIEGACLQEILERGPLSSLEAADLLTKALEVCELLSQVLGCEGVWLETDVRSMIVGAESIGRGVTFRVSPLKWLSKKDGQQGLEAIVSLAEEIRGWQGKAIPLQSAGGLGHWLKWLRSAARKTTLHEARQRLARAIGSQRPVPTEALVRYATAAPPPHRTGLLLATVGCVVLAFTALAAWMIVREKPFAALARKGRLLPAPEILETRMVYPLGQENLDATPLKAFRAEDGDRLADHNDQVVTVEGVLEAIHISPSGQTLYLSFAETALPTDICGAIHLGDAPKDLTEASLQPLLGTKVRLQGRVKMELPHHRPTIVIEHRNAIEAAE